MKSPFPAPLSSEVQNNNTVEDENKDIQVKQENESDEMKQLREKNELMVLAIKALAKATCAQARQRQPIAGTG